MADVDIQVGVEGESQIDSLIQKINQLYNMVNGKSVDVKVTTDSSALKSIKDAVDSARSSAARSVRRDSDAAAKSAKSAAQQNEKNLKSQLQIKKLSDKNFSYNNRSQIRNSLAGLGITGKKDVNELMRAFNGINGQITDVEMNWQRATDVGDKSFKATVKGITTAGDEFTKVVTAQKAFNDNNEAFWKTTSSNTVKKKISQTDKEIEAASKKAERDRIANAKAQAEADKYWADAQKSKEEAFNSRKNTKYQDDLDSSFGIGKDVKDAQESASAMKSIFADQKTAINESKAAIRDYYKYAADLKKQGLLGDDDSAIKVGEDGRYASDKGWKAAAEKLQMRKDALESARLNAEKAGVSDKFAAAEKKARIEADADVERSHNKRMLQISDEDQLNRKYLSTVNKMNDMLKNYSKSKDAGGKSREAYEALVEEKKAVDALNKSYNEGSISAEDYNKRKQEIINDANKEMTTLAVDGVKGVGFFDSIGNLASKFTKWFGVSQAVMTSVRALKSAVREVINVDSALTQMQIVTNASKSEMREFSNEAYKSARKTATSVTDIIDSATTYARLGYDSSESTMLAEYTSMLKNVAAIDTGEAQDAITSMVKAFNIETADIPSMMDKLVTVGNNFPISVSQIAEGMQNASSTLAASGNTFEESIALLTAANTTMQDAAKSSTGLRTISARLRNVKTELDSLGETVTEAEYQGLIDQLTKGGVNLRDSNGQLKSTYAVMKDLAAIWDTLDSGSQAAIAEALAGTRQQAVFYSIIGQFQEASGAMDAMLNSSDGAMARAYDIYLDSTESSVQNLKNSLSELATSIIDSGLLTLLINVGTALTTIVTQIAKLFNIPAISDIISAVGTGTREVTQFVSQSADTVGDIVKEITTTSNTTYTDAVSKKDISDAKKEIGFLEDLESERRSLLNDIEEYRNTEKNGGLSAIQKANMDDAIRQVDVLEGEINSAKKDVDTTKNKFASLYNKQTDEFGNPLEGYEDSVKRIIDMYPDMIEYAKDYYKVSSEAAVESAKAIDKSSDYATKTTALVESISKIQSAMSSQKSGSSIGLDTLKSEDVKNYASALEYVNGVYRLNYEAVNAIAKSNADRQIAMNKDNQSQLRVEYSKNIGKINEYTESLAKLTSADSKQAKELKNNISLLRQRNATLEQSFNEYNIMNASLENATGALANWVNAQNMADYGDLATTTESAIEKIASVIQTGEGYGLKYNAALELIVPDEVISQGQAAIEQYMNSMASYFDKTKKKYTDSTGKFFSRGGKKGGFELNTDVFIDKATQEGLLTKNGDLYSIADDVSYTDFMEKLNMSKDLVKAFMDELQNKGWDIQFFDKATENIDNLTERANESFKSLKERYNGIDGILDASGIDGTTEEKLAALDATIQDMKGIIGLNVNTEDVENAKTVIASCIEQKNSLTAPAYMKINVDKVAETDKELAGVIASLQKFKTLQTKMEIANVTGDAAGAKDIQAAMNEAAATVQNASAGLKAQIGIEFNPDVDPATAVASYLSKLSGMDAAEIAATFVISEDSITGLVPDDITINYKYEALNSVQTAFPAFGVPYYYYPIGGIPAGAGGSKAGGTARSYGTAYESGNWGTKHDETALVGELGREIVVDGSNGTWRTVGDYGAEFANIKKGSIIFNHMQTEQLLRSGRIFGRGRSYAGGTAYLKNISAGVGSDAVIKAVNAASSKTYNTTPSALSGAVQGNLSSALAAAITLKETAKAISDSNKKIAEMTGNNGGVGSGSGSGGGGGGGSSSPAVPDDSKKIDWIEITIKRIETVIDKLKEIAGSSFKKLSDRIKGATDAASKLVEQIDIEKQAYDRYVKEAESAGLSEDYAKKVRDGTIDIESIKDDNLKKRIESYKKWYDKALESSNKITKLEKEISEMYKDNFEAVQKDYENQIAVIESSVTTVENEISALESAGYMITAGFYESQKAAQEKTIPVLERQVEDMKKYLDEAVSDGRIEEYSEAWYDMTKAINDANHNLEDAKKKVIDLNKSIRDADWSVFDTILDRISSVNDEAEFLISLISNSKLFNKNGTINDDGLAVLGLRAQRYNTYLEASRKYAEELERINADIAKDPANKELIDRKKELLESQRDNILSANEEKNAIRDLVSEGYDKEIESMQELIDKYKETLRSEKDLYDYQRGVKKQTEEIASIQKQIAAYSNDTSAEARARVQRLNVSLDEARENLNSTQYDRFISDQEKLLDELMKDLRDDLDDRLDNIEDVIKDVFDSVNAAPDRIYEAITTRTDEVGYTIGDEIRSIWTSPEGSRIVAYGKDIAESSIAVNRAISSIDANVASMIAYVNSQIGGGINIAHSYASGASKIFRSQFAWTNENGIQEAIVRASDGAILTPLGYGDAVMNGRATKNLMRMMSDPSGFMLNNMSKHSGVSGVRTVNNSNNVSLENVNFVLPGVKNYEEFFNEMQRDNRFEKLVQTITLGRVSGGNSLKKYSV